MSDPAKHGRPHPAWPRCLMREIPDDVLAKLLAGELSRSDERRLAQMALANPQLFNDLTATALTRAAIESEPFAAGDSIRPVVDGAVDEAAASRSQRAAAAAFAALATAAAFILAFAYGWFSGRRSDAPPPMTSTAAQPLPVASPILLTMRVDVARSPAFRTDEAASRLPREAGTVVQIRDGIADVDLGSLDGLKQDATLRVVRG